MKFIAILLASIILVGCVQQPVQKSQTTPSPSLKPLEEEEKNEVVLENFLQAKLLDDSQTQLFYQNALLLPENTQDEKLFKTAAFAYADFNAQYQAIAFELNELPAGGFNCSNKKIYENAVTGFTDSLYYLNESVSSLEKMSTASENAKQITALKETSEGIQDALDAVKISLRSC